MSFAPVRVAIVFLLPAPVIAQGTVTLKVDLQISAAREKLSDVRSLSVSSSGRIAAPLHQELRVAVFSPDGRRLGTFGRKGEGPGEFGVLGGLSGWTGDTIWVHENIRGRTTLIGANLKLLRIKTAALTIRQASEPPGRGVLSAVNVRGRLPNGELLVQLRAIQAGQSRPKWFPKVEPADGYPVLRMGSDGVFRQLLFVIPATPGACSQAIRGAVVGVPFCSAPIVTVAPDGKMIVEIIPGESGKNFYRLVIRDGMTGKTTASLNVPWKAVAVPGSVIDSVRKAKAADRNLAPAQREVYRQLAFPRYYPPVQRIVIGIDSTIWIQEQRPPQRGTAWAIFDLKGTRLGSATTPSGFRLSVASRKQLWGITVDNDSEQTITRYRVTGLGS